LYKKITIFLLLINPLFSLSQNRFYLGLSGISSFGNTIKNDKEFKSKEIIDFGIHIGNQFIISNNFKFKLECFYLNNELVLARQNNGEFESNKRFELHQNIGLSIKPGLYKDKHNFYFIFSILGVYVFDKEEYTGRQFDRFDEAFAFGLEYNHNISKKTSVSLGYMYSEFESISNFTNHTLKSFSILHLTLNYYLY